MHEAGPGPGRSHSLNASPSGLPPGFVFSARAFFHSQKFTIAFFFFKKGGESCRNKQKTLLVLRNILNLSVPIPIGMFELISAGQIFVLVHQKIGGGAIAQSV
jgi:hypothetical protein